ncbi:IclR family transcriptional regulator [Halopseudomonas salegens]|uniref:Transcriptional regulator, IclR family n=1 Tax=Halopseudomonas salegens TaxID=1434072 RepID=A0A1H2HGJ9_9GAMM|nr:IclR family transcriptional regulator [Halopseudomonas salegens]SDU30936.1 transcriptional regulator, IclR family [Halopseudomonas salegens]
MSSTNDYRVPALERGLQIIELFHAGQRQLSTQDMADALGVSVSALYRIVQTLNQMGYLNKLGKNRYELGSAVVSAGFRYLASRDLVDVAQPHLNALRDRTSLSCHLSIRQQTDSLYLCRAFADQRLTVNIPVGTRIPCHASAMGRVLLCALSPAELDSLYQQVRLDDVPGDAPRTLPALRQLLIADVEQGWVMHGSDYSTAIATAVRNHHNEIVAAINLSAPEALLSSASSQSDYRNELLLTAARISAELGAPAD